MKRALLLTLVLLACIFRSFAQSDVEVAPKDAFLNTNYSFKGSKMVVNVDGHPAGPVFVEVTSSTLEADTYKIFTVDGKKLIATYTTRRSGGDIIKMSIEGRKAEKTFDLTEYLAKCSSDLEKDAVKRKVPVYWLYKNGFSK